MYNNQLNKKFQSKYEKLYYKTGIVAFSNCCRSGCTKAYDEWDEWKDENYRQKGIHFFRLHLNGMNYDPNPPNVYACYQDYEYLIENWENEVGIIGFWCKILGLEIGEYEITKPIDESEGIKIKFLLDINLEEPSEEYKKYYKIMEYDSRDFKYNKLAITKH